MNTHDYEVRRYRHGSREPLTWQAVCPCGWAGPTRDDSHAADEDGFSHRMAEIEA